MNRCGVVAGDGRLKLLPESFGANKFCYRYGSLVSRSAPWRDCGHLRSNGILLFRNKYNIAYHSTRLYKPFSHWRSTQTRGCSTRTFVPISAAAVHTWAKIRHDLLQEGRAAHFAHVKTFADTARSIRFGIIRLCRKRLFRFRYRLFTTKKIKVGTFLPTTL